VTADRRTRITIESERVVIVTAGQSQGRCEQCGREVNLSEPRQAGRVLETISARLGGTGPDRLRLEPAKNKFAVRLKSMLRSLKEVSSRHMSR
jgi:hypothetical protein